MPSGAFGAMPPIVAGLQFFGDLSSPATSIVSGAVATLGDSSGYGRHFPQGTAANRPTYNASDANFGGRPSMTFDGVDDFLASSSYGSGWTGRTVYVVFRVSSAAAEGRFFSDQVGSIASTQYVNILPGPELRGSFANPAGVFTSRAHAVSLSTSYALGVAYDPTNGTAAVPRMYLNGSSVGSYVSTSASSAASFSASTRGIGASPAGTVRFVGSITDVLEYSATHTDDQMTAMSNWLRWRNGL